MATLQLNDIKACYCLYLKGAMPPVSGGESGVPPQGCMEPCRRRARLNGRDMGGYVWLKGSEEVGGTPGVRQTWCEKGQSRSGRIRTRAYMLSSLTPDPQRLISVSDKVEQQVHSALHNKSISRLIEFHQSPLPLLRPAGPTGQHQRPGLVLLFSRSSILLFPYHCKLFQETLSEEESVNLLFTSNGTVEQEGLRLATRVKSRQVLAPDLSKTRTSPS
ncbi:unnamed protein product [Leuciscus chuanchicus]